MNIKLMNLSEVEMFGLLRTGKIIIEKERVVELEGENESNKTLKSFASNKKVAKE